VSYCPKCGAKLAPDARFCDECGHGVSGTQGYTQAATEDVRAKRLTGRYMDGFRLGRAIVGMGTLIKTIGGFAGLSISILAALGASEYARVGSQQMPLVVGGAIVLGFVVWLPFWILGVVVAAQGQILKAVLDTAVNSSPFLSNDEKAKIMSLG
jgi:hypothetical protein